MPRKASKFEYTDDSDLREVSAHPEPDGVKTQFHKIAVGYISSQGQDVKCGTCARFDNEDHSCSIVEGKLLPSYCCNFWGTAPLRLSEKISQRNAVVVTDNISHVCGACKYMRDPRGCAIVEGDIDPQGSCNLWVRGSSTSKTISASTRTWSVIDGKAILSTDWE